MITDPEIEAYLYGLLPKSAPVLAEMEEQARKRKIPIVGPAVAMVSEPVLVEVVPDPEKTAVRT